MYHYKRIIHRLEQN